MLETLLGAAIGVSLILYFVLGGADFGGGVWDLFATGPRAKEQRALIQKALAPVWEVNHVWLILVAVLLFGGFPPAFAAICTALHVPLTLFLLGVVFRGSAFAFRSYEPSDGRAKRWGLVFSLASLLAPILLGMMVGALASGEVRVQQGVVTSGFFAPWLQPFSWVAGLFSLSLCGLVAATFLTVEAREKELQDLFRKRAILAGISVAGLALLGFIISKTSAPLIYHGLTARSWSWPFHIVTALSAGLVFATLASRKYQIARFAVAVQVALIIAGWGFSQYPYVVVPDITFVGSAANPRTLQVLVIALACGMPVLGGAIYVLFKIFKTEPEDSQRNS